jgi:hypothetical protein
MPASAQGGYRSCNDARTSNQVDRHDGTAVGAVLGGLLGAGVGGGSTNCSRPAQGGPLPPPPGTYAPGYGYNDPGYGGQYEPSPSNQGYSSGYPDDYRDDPYYDDQSSRRVYAGDNRSYNRDDDYAGRDCSRATQITRLPDGTTIRRPVEACRDAYYGDWQVRD